MVQRSVGTPKYRNMRLSPEGVGESWLCLRRGSGRDNIRIFAFSREISPATFWRLDL